MQERRADATKGGSVAKKTTTSRASGTGATRKTAAAKESSSGSSQKATAPSKASSAKPSVKKHVGDVIGLGRSRASKSIPEGEGRAKGIEITPKRQSGTRPAKVVGGVRGRGR